MNNLDVRLDKIKSLIEDENFRSNRAQGGELNFYIFDYDPKSELEIRNYVKNLINSYNYDNSIIKPIELDLFELTLEILNGEKIKDKSVLEEVPVLETRSGTARLEKGLAPMLKPEKFTDLIKIKVEPYNLVLITGVGKVWPLLRSHTILNNLHHILDKIPVIMFYPGVYDQIGLSLFKNDKFAGITDDNYYRAFRLVAN